jgi:hypothetical protein
VSKVKEFLFKTLFPFEYREWKYRYNHTQTNYDMLVSTLIRSNPENSEWSSRFVALEKDYQALEKEVSEVYLDLFHARRQVRKLLDFTI